jgi:ferredoxin
VKRKRKAPAQVPSNPIVFYIDAASCIECGRCRVYCPVANAITINERYQHVVNADICTGCGLCEAFCPVPGTVFAVQRGSEQSLGPQQAAYLSALVRVVWSARWRCQNHPIMRPIADSARAVVREHLRQKRARLRVAVQS